MSFISRLESIAKGALRLLPIGEELAGAAGVPAGVLGQIDQAVQIAEAVAASVGAAKQGAQKSAAILPLVIDALKASALVRGHEVGDEALFTEAAQGFINSTVLLEKA